MIQHRIGERAGHAAVLLGASGPERLEPHHHPVLQIYEKNGQGEQSRAEPDTAERQDRHHADEKEKCRKEIHDDIVEHRFEGARVTRHAARECAGKIRNEKFVRVPEKIPERLVVEVGHRVRFKAPDSHHAHALTRPPDDINERIRP